MTREPGFAEERTFPKLLMARYYNSRGMERVPYRYAEHFEISVYLEDSGTLYIDGKAHSLHRGDMRFIRPGTHLRSTEEYSCYSFWLRFGARYGAAFYHRIACIKRACGLGFIERNANR